MIQTKRRPFLTPIITSPQEETEKAKTKHRPSFLSLKSESENENISPKEPIKAQDLTPKITLVSQTPTSQRFRSLCLTSLQELVKTRIRDEKGQTILDIPSNTTASTTYFLRETPLPNDRQTPPLPFDRSSPQEGVQTPSEVTHRIAIAKPLLGEPGMPGRGTPVRKGISPGEGCYRECIAYAIGKTLDVPPTVFIQGKVGDDLDLSGSLQKLEGLDPSKPEEKVPEATPAILDNAPEELHKIAILHILLWNTDGHLGNVLWDSKRSQAIPIDHGLVAPKDFEESARFGWLGCKKAKEKFTQKELDYINGLNWESLEEEIRTNLSFIPAKTLEPILKTIKLSFFLLKEGANKGLSSYQIAALMVSPSYEGNEERLSSALDDDDFYRLSSHDSIVRRLYTGAGKDESKFCEDLTKFLVLYQTELTKKGSLSPQEILDNPVLKDLIPLPEKSSD